MSKLGYDAMLLPGEELMYKILGVCDVSQHSSTLTGALYITSFQTFFVLDGKDQLKDMIPHGCISSIKKYKNQSTNNVPITDKTQYLELRCKDLRRLKYVLPASSRPSEVRRYLDCVSLPENLNDVFAYAYSPQVAALDEGWTVYNALEEYRRIGLISEGGLWRVSEVNTNFVLSPTYPEVLVVPATIDDKVLEKVAEFRSKGRIPSCVWKHSTTSATISRCSQPLVGLGRRSEDDEIMLREIQKANKEQGKTLYIVDARPKVNAAACTLSGGGTEIVGNYAEAHVSLEYCGIANIHVVRESFKRLGKVCSAWDPRKSKWSDVVGTHWLDHISSIVSAACKIVTYVDNEGCSVLTHCTDGWDRTSQLCALAELLMDPFYRTTKGFIILICKEFISFGHKFNTRNGNVAHLPRSQCAPIFVQFIDCVWQFTRQFPTSFEFSENLLLLLTTHLYTHLFGTFLCDNDCERTNASVSSQTASLWGLILNAPPTLAAHLTNPMYTPYPGTLHANGNTNSMQLWREYYQRCSALADDSKKEENGKLSRVNSSTNGEVRVVDPTLLHELSLIPFLSESMPHMEKAQATQTRKDMAVWLSMGGGKPRERALVLAPSHNKTADKFGSVRAASHQKHKHTVTTDDDDVEWVAGEDNGNGRGVIRRGRSFSAVFARMTGKGHKVRGRANSEDGKGDEVAIQQVHSTAITRDTIPEQSET